MIRFRQFFFTFIFFTSTFTWAQNKYEREFRISASEFPSNAKQLLKPYLENAKRIRFYHEIDSVKKSFEVKFKKDRLRYSIEFDENGLLEDVEFLIKTPDIPEESWTKINAYLKNSFKKVQVKKIQQQYPTGNSDPKDVLKEAFQNLILDHIRYELVFSAKKDGGFQTYEALFSSSGELIQLRKSFSPKYDHLLY